MARINEMRMPTWATLGLNYVKEEKVGIENIEKKPYFKEKNATGIKEVEEAFKEYRVGVSDISNKENKELRNFGLDFDIDGNRNRI